MTSVVRSGTVLGKQQPAIMLSVQARARASRPDSVGRRPLPESVSGFLDVRSKSRVADARDRQQETH